MQAPRYGHQVVQPTLCVVVCERGFGEVSSAQAPMNERERGMCVYAVPFLYFWPAGLDRRRRAKNQRAWMIAVQDGEYNEPIG